MLGLGLPRHPRNGGAGPMAAFLVIGRYLAKKFANLPLQGPKAGVFRPSGEGCISSETLRQGAILLAKMLELGLPLHPRNRGAGPLAAFLVMGRYLSKKSANLPLQDSKAVFLVRRVPRPVITWSAFTTGEGACATFPLAVLYKKWKAANLVSLRFKDCEE